MGEIQTVKGSWLKRRNLQHFADSVLLDGKKRGRSYRIGAISAKVRKAMHKQGVKMESNDLVITDDVILKYINHPKVKKGATLGEKEYYLLDSIARHPKHIYQDSTAGGKYLIFVFTGTHSPNKVVKAIIQPNKRINGRAVNWLKSIGVVERRALKNPQYHKIK